MSITDDIKDLGDLLGINQDTVFESIDKKLDNLIDTMQGIQRDIQAICEEMEEGDMVDG